MAMKSSVTTRNAAISLVWSDAGMPATQRTSAPMGVRVSTTAASGSSLILGCSAKGWDGDSTLWTSAAGGETPVRKPPRILVVDDNPTNIKIVQTRLASAGYDIVTAADGEEALVAVRELTPDLILLDVMMPRLDGIEVCRRLRADSALSFMPIILLTAMTETKDVIAGSRPAPTST
jgi:CheY-like chemotaxis protein